MITPLHLLCFQTFFAVWAIVLVLSVKVEVLTQEQAIRKLLWNE